MIARLKEDHDRLRDIAGRLETYLGEDVPPRDQGFAQLRWQLVRELSLHLAVERRTIEDWRAASGVPVDGLDYALDDAFVQHVVAWSGATVATAWDRYRDETRLLLRRLRDRMVAEESRIFPRIAGRRAA